MPNIKLQSCDGEIVDVDIEVAKMSSTLRNMIEDLGLDDEDDEEVLPLRNLSKDTLVRVVEWATRHKEDPYQPDEDETVEVKAKDIDQWDRDFFAVDQAILLNLINAAYYLNLQVMLEIGCHVVADLIKDKTTEEIREYLEIENDFTPEEEEALRKENAWIQEL